MSEPFIAEIRAFGFNFPPRGWATCDGQLLPIAQNTALFSLVGTTYGGNGRTDFGLPNLRGRVPIHEGQGPGLSDVPQGIKQGVETVTLGPNEIPDHDHALYASNDAGTTNVVTSQVLGDAGAAQLYGSAANLTTMNPADVPAVGASQSHTNMQPSLTINYCIALVGTFPSRN